VNRPFVSINMAASADGKITSAAREYPRMTSEYDRRNMDRLRAESDALLVGAQTMRADQPKLHVRTPEMQAYRRSLGKPQGLLKILVSASLRFDPASRFLTDTDGGGLIVATVEDAPADRRAALAARVEIWTVGRGRVDLPELLHRLLDRGVQRLLVEGGGELNAAFLEADLVDELYLTIAPCLLGGRDAPTSFEGTGLAMQDQRRLELREVHREGDELYCRYAVVR